MTNITMSLEEELIKKIRKIALDKGTTLTGLVRSHLVEIATQDAIKKEYLLKKLKDIYDTNGLDIGKKNWGREELHER